MLSFKMEPSNVIDPTEADFYPIFGEAATRVVGTLVWISCQVLGTTLILMLHELKTNDKAITLLNLVLDNCSCIQLVFNLYYVNMDFIRLWWGPLPVPVCTIGTIIILYNFLTISISFFIQTVLRFLYHTVWKNIGILNDEFFNHFFKIFTFVIASIWSFYCLSLGEAFDWRFCICIGLDTRNISEFRPQSPEFHRPVAAPILVKGVVGLFILTWLKLQWSKQRIRQVEAQQTSGYSTSTISLSLWNIWSHVLFAILIVVPSIPAHFVYKSHVKETDFSVWPMNWVSFLTNQTYHLVHSLCIPILEIVSVPKYRKGLMPLIKRKFQSILAQFEKSITN